MQGSIRQEGGAANRLDDRLIERCEEIPAELEPGHYVVIDTMHFSNTVIELLANGAEYVHITESRGDELAYRESNPRTVIGGGSTDEYDPEAGYDFFNSPSYVQRLDVEGRPISMTSSNGGRAITSLRERGGADVDVYVGSTMNAALLGAYLRDVDRPVHLVSSGSKGDVAVEDHIGATLISRYLDGVPVAETELDLFRRQLKRAKGVDYIDKHPIRRRDVLEYAMDLNARAVVPKMEDDVLVDAGPITESAAEPRAAD